MYGSGAVDAVATVKAFNRVERWRYEVQAADRIDEAVGAGVARQKGLLRQHGSLYGPKAGPWIVAVYAVQREAASIEAAHHVNQAIGAHGRSRGRKGGRERWPGRPYASSGVVYFHCVQSSGPGVLNTVEI